MERINISVIGLGYVGLPLACLMATKYKTVGFDIIKERIQQINAGFDNTTEVEEEELRAALKNGFIATNDTNLIKNSNFYIVTVPTPVDINHNPDFSALMKASETVGNVISKGGIVVFESTVYPGATEEICIPIIEKISGLTYNTDFFAGYSPERINPGDKQHRVENILKIVSGSTSDISNKVDEVYASVIKAGTYKASSIKVAEAAKVIENAQRDINIAFVNELAKIFEKLGLDTQEVLAAAATKWNFLSFKPGLVGGHCIGVDPYYLAQSAEQKGYHPEIILAGRRLNDSMGDYVANQVVKLMLKKKNHVYNSDILILGLTFKENVKDIRNTKVIDIIGALREYNAAITIYDPLADVQAAEKEYGLTVVNRLPKKKYNAVILAVAHNDFKKIQVRSLLKGNGVVYDVKGFFDHSEVDGRL